MIRTQHPPTPACTANDLDELVSDERADVRALLAAQVQAEEAERLEDTGFAAWFRAHGGDERVAREAYWAGYCDRAGIAVAPRAGS